jgi:hypothetical protein
MIEISYIPLIANTHPKNLSIYQFYYLYGFEQYGAPVRFPWNRFGIEYRIRSSEIGKRLIRNRYDLVQSPDGSVGLGEVGTYLLRENGAEIKFAIDASDHGHVVSQAAYDWCDVYFKGTKWENRQYGPKVRPLVFGHNYMTKALFRTLKSYRTTAKTVDLVFINRILGGAEHNVRLFETLGALRCRKMLICIAYGHETPEQLDRLRAAGVTVRPWLSQERFWEEMSRGRLAFNRSGRSLCIPWKMSALLCMGAATVFDDRPRPNWPVPLVPGRHYINCDLGLPDERGSREQLAPIDYSKVTATVEAALADPAMVAAVARESADYFDRHASPVRVADYIVDVCRRPYEPTASGQGAAPSLQLESRGA